MAGRTVGSAEINLDYDGSALPAQAKKWAELAGRAAGKQFTRAFNKQSVGTGTAVAQSMRRATRATNQLTRAIQHQASWWKRLSANTRQWTLIVGAVAAGGQDIAVLGSAAGAGLAVLGSAFTSTAIGAGVAIAAFQNLTGELEDLPVEVRPAAKAFQELGDEFDTLQDKIQIAALQDAEGAFESMRGTVRELTPAFESVGKVVGELLDELAAGIAPGTKNFERLQKLIRDSGPIFRKVAQIAGRFGEALLAMFSDPAMVRSVNEFLGWLQEIADRFLEFAESPELDRWLGHARQVFGSFGRLLEATGRMLNNLVDQESVGRLTGFLDNLALFMPSLETLLDILGELDVFGLIAEALVEFSDALSPLAGPAEDLAEALNDMVQAGIDRLAPIFENIAEGLAPLAQGVADFIDADPQRAADLMLALAGAAVILKGTGGLAGLSDAVVGQIGGMATAIKDKDWKKLGSGLGKAGAKSFIPALLTGLFTGEGGAGVTIAVATLTGLQAAGLPGLIAGALIGAIVSMFTDTAAWANGADQISTFFSTQVVTWWNEGWAATPGKFENGWTQLSTWWEGLRTGVNTWVLEVFFPAVATWWNEGWAGTIAKFTNGWEQISTWWEGLKTAVNTWIVDVFWAGVVTWWNEGWASTVAKFSNGWDQIVTWWEGLRTSVNTWFATFWSGVVTWWNTGWARTATSFANGWTQLKTWFENILSSAERWIRENFWSGIKSALDSFKRSWDSFWGSFKLPTLPIPSIPGLTSSGGRSGGGGGMAAGGVVWGPQRRLIGEAGPEAVVPLNRPLSKVDPSVRELSRIAQGGGMASGGVVGGRTVIVEAGAITVVSAASDGRVVAGALLDRIVANLPS